MRKRSIVELSIQISVLTVLGILYGLSLLQRPPVYLETVAVSAVLVLLFGVGCVRLVPTLMSMLTGEEPHMKREGDRTFRRCGTRELFKLFLIVLAVRLLEFPLTYIVHYLLFGFTGTFFEVQRLWLDFYHPETAFPLYGYLSNVFWIVTVNFNHARFIGSYFFTALAAVVLYYLVQLDFDRRVARRTVRYFLLMPYALTLMGTVPDGLFLLLSVLTLLFLRRNKFPLATLFAFLAVLTHALGALLFFPVVASYVSYLYGNVSSNRATEKGFIIRQILNTLSILLIPLGIGLVMLYSRLRFGDAMWLYNLALGRTGEGTGTLMNWLDSAFSLVRTVGGNSTAILFGTYAAQFVYVLFALIMFLLACKTIPSSFTLLMAVTIPMIALCGHVPDTARAVTMTAPFVITLAARVKNRIVDTIITLVLFAGWLAYFFAFIAGFTGGGL